MKRIHLFLLTFFSFGTLALAKSPVDRYVDETIVYVPPTPIHNEEGEIVGYTNTYEEQRARYRDQVERWATSSVEATQRAYAPTFHNLNYERTQLEATRQELDSRAKGYGDTVHSQLQESDNPSKQGKLGRTDRDNDGVITSSEINYALIRRDSMSGDQHRNGRKLDRDGDGSISLAESLQSIEFTDSKFRGDNFGQEEMNQRLYQIRTGQAEALQIHQNMQQHARLGSRPHFPNEAYTMEALKHQLPEEMERVNQHGRVLINAVRNLRETENPHRSGRLGRLDPQNRGVIDQAARLKELQRRAQAREEALKTRKN